MTVVQTITTPNGDEMVVVPKAEWERLLELLEDAEDSAHHERIMKNFREGKEEFLPLELVERLCGDESPLFVWREYRGLTVDQLASAGAVPADAIEGIEAGRLDPPVSVLRALATVLRIDVDDLIPR